MKAIVTGVLVALIALAGIAHAEVQPEIRLDGRGIMSMNVDDAVETTSAVSDFSDTSLLIGFRQKLYSRYRSQFVLGFQFPDADSDLGQVFFHQAFIRVEDRSNILKIGRSRVQTALIEFPTLRDDDALTLTNTLNPFSAGENTQDSQYGDVFEVSHVFGQRVWLRAHGEHLTKTPVAPATIESDFSLNTLGGILEYRVPQSQRFNRPFLAQLGAGILTNFLDDDGTQDASATLTSALFSTVLNLHPDPVHFIDLRNQTILTFGLDGTAAVDGYGDLARARSIRTLTSLRYLLRKLEFPTLQLALSAGYATFPDLTNASDQFQLIASSFYRLGENFDVGAQFQYRRSTGDLRNVFSANERRFQVALIYAVEQVWNNQFGDRGSLLNLEHGYIP